MSDDGPFSIGLYTYSNRPRGSVVHCAALADALSIAGHAVTIYALARPGTPSFFRTTEAQLVEIACEPGAPGLEQRIEQRIGELSRCLRELRPDHDVHHAQDCLAASALLRARPRGALVRTVHHVESFASGALERMQARSIRELDLVLSVSDATRREVLRSYGMLSVRVENGVDAGRIARPLPGAVGQLRARLGDCTLGPTIVSFGGIDARKNTRRLLDAFLLVRRRFPHARWLLVGGASVRHDSAYRREFEQRLAECSEAERRAVVCTGALGDAELTACYALADVVAVPSLREGFGLCALEALAAGVPVVASRRAPFTEFLDDDCALLVEPESTLAIAHALLKALSGERASERTRLGRERARRYDWGSVAACHDRLYRGLLSAPVLRAAY